MWLSGLKTTLSDPFLSTPQHLLSGGLEFVSSHADHVLTVATRSDVDMEACRLDEGLPNSLETVYTSKPLLIWRLLRLALDCRPAIVTATPTAPSSVVEDTSIVSKAACLAGASLLAAMNRDHRLQLVGKCIQWLVEGDPDVDVVMTRLQSLFAILEK